MYGSGGAAYYILGYGTLAYILSYYLLPAVWRYATPRRLVSQADVFVTAYRSRALGILVSVVAVAAMIPYLALQFKGLGEIVSATSYGKLSATPAIWIGAFAMSIYVAASGIRGSAWTAVDQGRPHAEHRRDHRALPAVPLLRRDRRDVPRRRHAKPGFAALSATRS